MPNRITPAARPFQEARQGIGLPNQVEEDTDVHPQGRKQAASKSQGVRTSLTRTPTREEARLLPREE